jgi:hypothetical protein
MSRTLWVQTVLPPPVQQLVACQACEISFPQPGGGRKLVVLLSKVRSGLVQHRSGSTVGSGMGLPHCTTTPAELVQSSVGGDGTRVTNWVHVVVLLQQSTAFQISEIVAPHPTELVTIPIWVTLTPPPVPAVLVQQGDTTAGGVVGNGPPQGAVVFVHTRTGAAGNMVTC